MKKFNISSAMLHIIAMTLMFADHLWAVLLPGWEWLTCIGRIAFPIFAFMLVEGFFYTSNIKKYFKRLFIFALISEIPFDFVYSGTAFYPYHQNVLWTFILGLALIWCIDSVKKKNKLWLTILVSIGVTIAGYVIGMIIKPDYYGSGIVTLLIFYFFRGRKWWCFLGQFACLYYIEMEVLGGYYYVVNFMGMELEIIQQGFALLALIPIWLYNGRKGFNAKWFKYFCYGFYPAHLALLYLIYFVLYRL